MDRIPDIHKLNLTNVKESTQGYNKTSPISIKVYKRTKPSSNTTSDEYSNPGSHTIQDTVGEIIKFLNFVEEKSFYKENNWSKSKLPEDRHPDYKYEEFQNKERTNYIDDYEEHAKEKIREGDPIIIKNINKNRVQKLYISNDTILEYTNTKNGV
ncbi:MAG: hypothetical protein MHMPM18_002346 [Marteilia pararefringens]